MLQLPTYEAPPAPPMHRSKASTRRPSSALDLIDAKFGPLGFEPDLFAEAVRLRFANDVRGMVALFNVYKDVGETFLRMMNQPYAGDVEILEDEYARAWSKAYLVADHLKLMQPVDDVEKQFMAEALFSCALMMGHSLSEATSIAKAVNDLPNHVAEGRAVI